MHVYHLENFPGTSAILDTNTNTPVRLPPPHPGLRAFWVRVQIREQRKKTYTDLANWRLQRYLLGRMTEQEETIAIGRYDYTRGHCRTYPPFDIEHDSFLWDKIKELGKKHALSYAQVLKLAAEYTKKRKERNFSHKSSNCSDIGCPCWPIGFEDEFSGSTAPKVNDDTHSSAAMAELLQFLGEDEHSTLSSYQAYILEQDQLENEADRVAAESTE